MLRLFSPKYEVILLLSMWSEVSFLKKSKSSGAILGCLDEPKTPVELRKRLGLHLASVSRTILKLEEYDLVECLTPDSDKFRLYRITSTGRKVLHKWKHLENKK